MKTPIQDIGYESELYSDGHCESNILYLLVTEENVKGMNDKAWLIFKETETCAFYKFLNKNK